ncbi:DUF4377 domain-containing protein, partial [Morganella morganii]|uniref:DUF4377 domain-containing protein n=2 Tax=Morganella morganii TaxID=582 RepID=UPI003EB8D372
MKSAYVIAPLFLLMAGCSQNARTDQAAENTRTLYIDSELADCVGVAPMKCMKIKESPDTEWEFFYQNIDGFTYEPGYQYRVSVKTTDVPNPPADAPNIRYQLISVLNKDPVPAKDAKIGMANPALMNPLMILVKIIKLRWIHILSYDQMVSRKINNQTTRCANSI